MKTKYLTMNEGRKYLGVSANGIRHIIGSYNLTVHAPPDAPWKRKYLIESELREVKKLRKAKRRERTKVEDTDRNSKYTDKKGYVNVYRPFHPLSRITGYVYEHTLVMEEIVGRYLTAKENVHHIDGDTRNNKPENLHLFASHGEHLKRGHYYNFKLKYYVYKLQIAKTKGQFNKILLELNTELKKIFQNP